MSEGKVQQDYTSPLTSVATSGAVLTRADVCFCVSARLEASALRPKTSVESTGSSSLPSDPTSCDGLLPLATARDAAAGSSSDSEPYPCSVFMVTVMVHAVDSAHSKT